MDDERGLIRRFALPVATLLAAAAVAFGLYRLFWPPAPSERPQAEAPAAPSAPAAPQPEPAAAFPLPGEPPEAAMAAPAQPGVDAMAAFERDLAGLADPAALARFFYVEPDALVRRLVSSVDNLSADELPLRARAVRPIGGAFVVSKGADGPVIDPANARRYQPFVALVESIDPRRAAQLYIAHYRLFQGEYRGQGSPNRYFNDRVVAAIDHLLATPEVREPIRLVQPRVLYRYADPELEALSAGQKALLRMGPDNAARIKARLRAFRAEIVRQGARAPGAAR